MHSVELYIEMKFSPKIKQEFYFEENENKVILNIFSESKVLAEL